MQEEQSTESSSQALTLERTHLALVRTQFALMRTGFTVASFGAGVSQLLGRGNWPQWATDALTSLFILVGMILVQSALMTSSHSAREFGVEQHAPPFVRFSVRVVPWLLQAGLLAMLLFLLTL